MAVIIRDNTLNGDMWNEWATLMNAAIYDADIQKNKYDDLVTALANEMKSSRWAEKSSTIGGLGDYSTKEEGADAKYDYFAEGYSKLIEHITFAKSVSISKEMVDDNQIAEMKSKAINLVQSYKRTRAKFLSLALTSSVGSTKTMDFADKSNIDISCADNLALFNTNHTLKNAPRALASTLPAGAITSAVLPGVGVIETQSNLFSNAFGSDTVMLNKLSNVMRNFKDDGGEVLGLEADTIVIPGNRPVLEDLVKRIIGSDGEVGSNKNDINTQRGKWKLVVDYLWTPASGDPYIIMSSQANKELMATRLYDRTTLDVVNEVKNESRNLLYNGFARMSVGFTNWRHVLMGGVTGGTTLS
jgi:phage major head subunit gpT-like protein